MTRESTLELKSRFTRIIFTGSFLYFFAVDSNQGSSSIQGLHQVAQKFRTYNVSLYFPLSEINVCDEMDLKFCEKLIRGSKNRSPDKINFTF